MHDMYIVVHGIIKRNQIKLIHMLHCILYLFYLAVGWFLAGLASTTELPSARNFSVCGVQLGRLVIRVNESILHRYGLSTILWQVTKKNRRIFIGTSARYTCIR